MSLNYSFFGKSILVTGGGQGIGKTIVRKFHEGGAMVFTIDKNAETIAKLKEELPGITAEVVDLTDWEATRATIEGFGVIDYLVNNAGMIKLQNFMDITKDSASLQFDVNVCAAVNVTQVVAKKLIAEGRGGSVVNISSCASRFGSGTGGVMYGATKAALENLTKSMAIELGPHNIRVNCILPGFTDAPMLHQAAPDINEDVMSVMMQRVIFKRMVDPKEIADLVMFLLSPLSSMVVGENVVIDGGFLTS